MSDQARIDALVAAFADDGWRVDPAKGVFRHGERIGLRAKHATARHAATNRRKRAYYVEGSPFETGFLMGLMAAQRVERMATEFSRRVPFAFLDLDDGVPGAVQDYLGGLLLKVIDGVVKKARDDVPDEFHQEIRGLVHGCREASQPVHISKGKLWTLNIGIDCLLPLAYAFDEWVESVWPWRKFWHKVTTFLGEIAPWIVTPARRNLEKLKGRLRVPLFCNAFALFGDATEGDGHFFGRDFMFPTAGVFDETAALVVYRPMGNDGPVLRPLVSVTAPGIVGSIAAMNADRVAAGVDMLPAGNCDAKNPGMNSLPLVRDCVQRASTGTEAVDRIEKAKRGVSWIYIVSDGKETSGKVACVVEAGRKEKSTDTLLYADAIARRKLPTKEFLDAHESAEMRRGMMVRWNGWTYPSEYLDFNRDLWSTMGGEEFDEAEFGPTGYINRRDSQGHVDERCPGPWYFAPQREGRPDVVLTTNHAVIPEMRLCGMSRWTADITKKEVDDIQWRYDELASRIHDALAQGPIGPAKARSLIDFLGELGYYDEKGERKDGKLVIGGATCLFDLSRGTVEAHYGTFEDEWVTLTLPRYVISEPPRS